MTRPRQRDGYLEKRQDSLAGRLRAGDHAAVAELVDMYYERIYLFMKRCGYSWQVSEDLTQESFLRAWQHIGRLRSDEALNSWLYHIAVNVSKLYWRRHKGVDVFGHFNSGTARPTAKYLRAIRGRAAIIRRVLAGSQ